MADNLNTTINESPKNDRHKFPIVALCASAGGLDAFLSFFDVMPANSGMAFIVVQHLASQQESMLHELIQRHTLLAVHPITDEMLVEENNIYVLPAGYDLHIWDKQLRLTPRGQVKGWPTTIDNFLKSLAQDQGEWAASVILSGVGDDGAEGSHIMKQERGLVLAQSIDSAAQSGMPLSIADFADAILSPEQMPDALLSHFNIESHQAPQFRDLAERITDDDITHIIQDLQRQTALNFTDYKHSTLRRQIARRMGINQLPTVDAYRTHIKENPSEVDELAKYLLINVTEFFRDPESFEALKRDAIRPALSHMNIDTIFRAWVPGCASGEEAISIAILIYECLRELDMPQMEVRIFATDVDHDILQIPRRGLYPRTIAEAVSAERLRDHFIEEDQGYRVRSHITRMIIWAQHNLVDNPPFSSLHLISCRNVMIYFQQRLQDRVLAFFQFALQPTGILFLGSSETLPYEKDAFVTIDSKHKIFQRSADGKGSWLRLDQPLFIRTPDYEKVTMPNITSSSRPEHDDYELDIIKSELIEHYASTCVLVDEQYRVRYTYGEIDLYLRIVPGRAGQNNILDMTRKGLDVELTLALHHAFDGDDPVIRQEVWAQTSGDERIINIIVLPVKNPAVAGRWRLVIFELAVTSETLKNEKIQVTESDEGVTVSRLREELLQTQKALQKVTLALQAKGEELTSSMEEIRSASEEIQTTNEELRTSKEELESMNEELNTLNTQLIDQNFELSGANDTLHNLLQSADISIIFLDQDLAIREYTSSVTQIFGLRSGDKGRPLADIVNQLVYDSLIVDAETVLNTLNNFEREVYTLNGYWYNLRIRPYRTIANAIDGLALTFSDITIQKQSQDNLEKRGLYIRQVFDTLDDSLLELDHELRIVGANQSFFDLLKTTEADTIGKLLYELGSGQWNIKELRHLLTEIIPDKKIVHDYDIALNLPDLGLHIMKINARQIAEVNRILLVITDVSVNGN